MRLRYRDESLVGKVNVTEKFSLDVSPSTFVEDESLLQNQGLVGGCVGQV